MCGLIIKLCAALAAAVLFHVGCASPGNGRRLRSYHGGRAYGHIGGERGGGVASAFRSPRIFLQVFYRFPQMEFGARKEKEGRRLWYGQAFNLDEASEWLKNLSLIGCPGEKSKATSINPHTSTLNTLIARGKTKRAARTSTSYEGKASQRVSFSVLGNGHPTRIIAMERNLEGQHTAATRERFMMCVNSSVARRDALPESMLVADPDLPAFTWLPLTTLQAAIFKREGVVNNPEYFANSVAESQDADQEGYPIAFPDGVPSRIRYKVQTDDRGALAWILTCCGGEVYIVLYWAGEQKMSRRAPAASLIRVHNLYNFQAFCGRRPGQNLGMQTAPIGLVPLCFALAQFLFPCKTTTR